MRRSFGQITQRGEGVFLIRWTAGGVRRSRTIHGSRRDAARALAEEQTKATAPLDATWSAFWADVVRPSFNRDGLAAKTVADYERVWRHDLEPRIGGHLLSATTPAMVDKVLGGLRPAVAAHDARVWKKAANMAVRAGYLTASPFNGLRIKQPRKAPKILLQSEEVAPFMEAVNGLKYEAVLLCELGGGLRHEEACALTWEDVSEWEYRGTLYAVLTVSKALLCVEGVRILKEPKTATSAREVVVGEPFASRLLSMRCSGPLLPSGYGTGVNAYSSPETLTHNFRAWCHAHGVKYVQPKNLRSTFATLHGEAGSPDSLVSGAMGHADATTKARNYQQITRRGLALIADNLAEYLQEFQD